jgi:hypothetical protein
VQLPARPGRNAPATSAPARCDVEARSFDGAAQVFVDDRDHGLVSALVNELGMERIIHTNKVPPDPRMPPPR